MGTIVRFDPSGVVWEAKHAITVLEAARRAGVPIRTRCSGKAGCLMCKINVTAADNRNVGAPTLAEQHKLGIDTVEGLRLACQVRLTGKQGSITVGVPLDPLKALVKQKLQEQKEDDKLW